MLALQGNRLVGFAARQTGHESFDSNARSAIDRIGSPLPASSLSDVYPDSDGQGVLLVALAMGRWSLGAG